MSIEIVEQFEVEQSPGQVWDFLVDPARVVRCLPGARLVEVTDERTFRGEVGIRLGPFSAAFTGTIHFDILDRENHRVAMSGEGRDARNIGAVAMSLDSTLMEREGGGTLVSVLLKVRLAGRLAAFYWGPLIRNAAHRVFRRFTACVAATLARTG